MPTEGCNELHKRFKSASHCHAHNAATSKVQALAQPRPMPCSKRRTTVCVLTVAYHSQVRMRNAVEADGTLPGMLVAALVTLRASHSGLRDTRQWRASRRGTLGAQASRNDQNAREHRKHNCLRYDHV
jgi:hypothetical protein